MAAMTEMIVKIEMDDDVRAIFDEAKRYRDLMEPVVTASVRLFDCIGEFTDQPMTDELMACGAYQDAWEAAVLEYKILRAQEP